MENENHILNQNTYSFNTYNVLDQHIIYEINENDFSNINVEFPNCQLIQEIRPDENPRNALGYRLSN